MKFKEYLEDLEDLDIIDGDIDELIEKLMDEDRKERLAATNQS